MRAQSQPRLIHRFEIAGPPADMKRVLQVVNVGDRGGILDNGDGTFTNSTVKDGCDDFAVLFDPPVLDTPGGGLVWVYDGRTGHRYVYPNGSSTPLEYKFPRKDVLTNVTKPGGICGDGGKDLIGDTAYPDLVIGGPGYKQDTLVTGRIWVLDMKDFDPDVTTPGPNNKIIVNPRHQSDGDAEFGNSVRIMGDFAGNDRSEILVGAIHSDPSQASFTKWGAVYVINPDAAIPVVGTIDAVNNPWVNLPICPWDCDAYSHYGFSTAVIGDVATKDLAGVHQWGQDGRPEVAVADPFWSYVGPGCPSCTPLLQNGLLAWFNMYRVELGSPPAVVLGHYSTTGRGSFMGAELSAMGDTDLGVNNPAGSGLTPSWDFGRMNGNRVEFTPIDTSPISSPMSSYGHSDAAAAGAYLPHWARPGAWENAHGRQLTGIGDINLDNSTQGFDDYALVSYNVQDVIDGSLLRHEIHVYDASDTINVPPSLLFVIKTDPGSGQELLGTPTDIPWGVFGPARRTTVSRLGDVDGDGLDDFGVVSGYSTDDPYQPQEEPTHAVILIYGAPALAGTPTPPGLPRLKGNTYAQRGSRIAVRIENCPAGAMVTLWEDLSQGAAVPECGGTRTVGGTQYSLTADSEGMAYFIRGLNYGPAGQPDTTPGTQYYYQARVDGYGSQPPYAPCRLTNVRTVTIIDSSNPLDEFRGDS